MSDHKRTMDDARAIVKTPWQTTLGMYVGLVPAMWFFTDIMRWWFTGETKFHPVLDLACGLAASGLFLSCLAASNWLAGYVAGYAKGSKEARADE